MNHRIYITLSSVLALCLAQAAPAGAQLEASASAQGDLGGSSSADSDIELGDVDSGPATSLGPSAGTGPARRGGGGLRLGIQARLNALNLLGGVDQIVGGGTGLQALFVPVAMPGVRLLDGRLFLGVGLGLAGYSAEDDDGDEASRFSFAFSPGGSFDLIRDASMAMSLGGWLNLASVGETEVCPDGTNCMSLNDNEFGWGFNLALGLRGAITRGLVIGAEFGWGFLSVSEDPAGGRFQHGIFGNILVEGSVGL